MGDWRSGSAGALQAQGRGFKSLIAHQDFQARRMSPGFFLRGRPRVFARSAGAMPRNPVDAQAVSIPRLVLALWCNRSCCEKRGAGDGSLLAGCRLPAARVAIGSMSPRPVPDCSGRFRFVPTWFVAPPPDPIRFILFRFDSFLPDRPGRFRFDPTRPVPSRFGRSHTVLTECGRPVPSRLDSSHPVPFSPVLHRLDWLRPDLASSSRPVPFGPSLPDLFRMPPFAPASGLARWATRGRGSSRMPRAF